MKATFKEKEKLTDMTEVFNTTCPWPDCEVKCGSRVFQKFASKKAFEKYNQHNIESYVNLSPYVGHPMNFPTNILSASGVLPRDAKIVLKRNSQKENCLSRAHVDLDFGDLSLCCKTNSFSFKCADYDIGDHAPAGEAFFFLLTFS